MPLQVTRLPAANPYSFIRIRFTLKEVNILSLSDPKSEQDLRGLAQKARNGSLSKNEQAELDRQTSQTGKFGRELKKTAEGK